MKGCINFYAISNSKSYQKYPNLSFKSFNKRLPTARVMYALIALGVLQKDSPLIPMTLKQVEVLEDVPQSIEDFIALLSYVHMFQVN